MLQSLYILDRHCRRHRCHVFRVLVVLLIATSSKCATAAADDKITERDGENADDDNSTRDDTFDARIDVIDDITVVAVCV
jgi:hypothetical protein